MVERLGPLVDVARALKLGTDRPVGHALPVQPPFQDREDQSFTVDLISTFRAEPCRGVRSFRAVPPHASRSHVSRPAFSFPGPPRPE